MDWESISRFKIRLSPPLSLEKTHQGAARKTCNDNRSSFLCRLINWFRKKKENSREKLESRPNFRQSQIARIWFWRTNNRKVGIWLIKSGKQSCYFTVFFLKKKRLVILWKVVWLYNISRVSFQPQKTIYLALVKAHLNLYNAPLSRNSTSNQHDLIDLL